MAASYLLNEGDMRSAPLNELTREIVAYCSIHGVVLVLAYLLEVENLGEDVLSRGWRPVMVSGSGGDEEDLQAYWHTRGRPFCLQQVDPGPEIFYSGQERQQGIRINALQQPWEFGLMYAFPLPQLIPLILANMTMCSGNLDHPAAWLLELKQLSTQQPLRLPQQQSAVTDLSTGRDLPPPGKLRLTVWYICWNPFKVIGQVKLCLFIYGSLRCSTKT